MEALEKFEGKIAKKELIEEVPSFVGFELKKGETVKCQWSEGQIENIDLLHHDFESIPVIDLEEKTTNVILGKEIIDEEFCTKQSKRQKGNKIKVSIICINIQQTVKLLK